MDKTGRGIVNALVLGLQAHRITQFLINAAQQPQQEGFFLLSAFSPPFHDPVPFTRLFQRQAAQRLAAVQLAAQFLLPLQPLSANHFKQHHIIPAEQLVQARIVGRLRHMNGSDERHFPAFPVHIGGHGRGQALPVAGG